MRMFLAALMCVALVGCKTPWNPEGEVHISMNAQKAALRAAGDVSITSYLDHVKEEKADEYRQRSYAIAQKVRAFLDSGDVAALTVGELRTQVLKLVPSGYESVASTLLAATSGVTVDTDVIGPANVKRLRAICKGVEAGALEYSVKER